MTGAEELRSDVLGGGSTPSMPLFGSSPRVSAIAFIHGHAHTPQVARDLADHCRPRGRLSHRICSQSLASVRAAGTPRSHGRPNQPRPRAYGLGRTVVVVAEGLGAIPAIQYAARTPRPGGRNLPVRSQLALSRAEAMRLRVAEKIRRADAASASDKQVAAYLSGLVGLDEHAVAERLEVARIAVVGEKDRGGTKGATALKAAGWEHDVVLQAEPDWYAYAPSAFAARVTQFAART